jgi:hypothetical protein
MNRPDRDLEILEFTGVYRQVSQGQIHARVFPGLSEVVVTRRVRSLADAKLLAVDRMNKTGINLIRLTNKGLDLLIEAGRKESDYFVPGKPVALKDLAHTLWSNDIAIMLQSNEPKPVTVMPACQLQRRWVPPPEAIPDLLAIYELAGLARKLVLSIEVDLGAERLNSTFLPKLQKCADLLKNEWAPNDFGVIVVFTKGRRRALSLLKAATESLPVPIIVQLLPSASGRETLRLISRAFRRYRVLVARAIAATETASVAPVRASEDDVADAHNAG